MRRSTGRHRAFAWTTFAAVAAVALAQVGQGQRTTAFHSPQWFNNSGDCIWSESHQFGAKDSQTGPDDDGGSGWDSCVPSSTRQAHSRAAAQGEQIEAYGWAYDTCAGDSSSPTSAISAGANDTQFTINQVSTPPGCGSLMRVDMRPWFKARAQCDAPGSASAHGKMESYCTQINQCKASIEGTVKSEGGVNGSSYSFGYSTVQSGGMSASGSMSSGTGGGSVEQTFTTYAGDQKPVTSATVNVLCTVDVSVTADSEGDWIDTAETEAWVWDSKPQIDLHANCPPVCTAYAYWLY
jgi:hypothetical protein